jgi:hypothetical protein
MMKLRIVCFKNTSQDGDEIGKINFVKHVLKFLLSVVPRTTTNGMNRYRTRTRWDTALTGNTALTPRIRRDAFPLVVHNGHMPCI